MAGGYGLRTPFGTIYSTNITPDPETGIGRWSLAAFARAMHEGVSRDGSHLFPAFPYDHFTKVSDDDVKALYAYLMTRPPVRAAAPREHDSLPAQHPRSPGRLEDSVLQERPLSDRTRPRVPSGIAAPIWPKDSAIVAAVTRRAICSAPKKPRTRMRVRVIDDWIAPALTDANPIAGPVDADELFGYLRTGVAPLHGVTAGPMSPVVHDWSLGRAGCRCPAPWRSISPISTTRAPVEPPPMPAVKKALADVAARQRPGIRPRCAPLCRRLYRRATTMPAQAPLPARPELALNSALTLPEPTNLIHVVLDGIGITEGGLGSGDARLCLGTHRRRHREARGLSAPHPHRPPALD